MTAVAFSYNSTDVDRFNGTVGNDIPTADSRWSNSTNITDFDYGNDIVSQEGTAVCQLTCATGLTYPAREWIRVDLGGSTFDLTANDLSWWFFYVKGKGDQIIADTTTGEAPVSVRVYSDATPGTSYAEWDLAGNESLIASWNFFTISGDTPSRVGAGGAPTYTAIRHIEFRFAFARGTNGGGFGQQDEPIGLDWIKYGNTITITGGTTPDPAADFAQLLAWSDGDEADRVNDPAYGLVFSRSVLFEVLGGIDFGNGTAACRFTDINKVLINRTFSDQVEHNYRVRNGSVVTFGTKDVGSQDTYAIEGCQLVCPDVAEDGSSSELPLHDFEVQTNGTLNAYGSKFFRWNTIDINDDAELIDDDFADNVTINLDSADISATGCDFHDAAGSGFIGSISAAVSFNDCRVFNNVRGFEFTASITVRNYIATDNSVYDLVVNNTLTVTLVDSTFDKDKILQN